MLVKICGMKYKENIESIGGFRPDFMGFIFFSASPRYVGEHFLIPSSLDSSIKRVGVFVNESPDTIMKLASFHHLDYVQLHGEEPVDLVNQLATAGVKIIKAFSVDSLFDFSQTYPYQKFCKYFLFDTKGITRGGTGKVFDWSILSKYEGTLPFLLSGGLSIAQLVAIKRFAHDKCIGLDVNSGIEDSPGLKNVELAEIFLKEFK